jgi:hypothetical protein
MKSFSGGLNLLLPAAAAAGCAAPHDMALQALRRAFGGTKQSSEQICYCTAHCINSLNLLPPAAAAAAAAGCAAPHEGSISQGSVSLLIA